MVAAILNPLCCCNAAVLASLAANAADGNPAGDSVAGAEGRLPATGCCQSSRNSNAPASPEEHDPAECAHAALKDYKNNTFKEVSAKGADGPSPLLLPAFIERQGRHGQPPALRSEKAHHASAGTSPPRILQRLYCVYRI